MKKNYKKVFFAFIMTLVISMMFVPQSAEAVELTVWGVRDTYLLNLDEWQEQNPDIEIDYEVVPWERTLDQLILSAATDRTPDVVVLDKSWIPILGGLGHLHSLDNAVEEYWSEEERNDFFDASWKFGQHKDTQYAIPFAYEGRVLYYRSDWFEKYDLDPPETWDDLIEAGKIISEEEGVQGLSIRGARDDGTAQRWLPVYTNMGGELVNEVPQLDSEAGIEALELYHDLVWEHEIMSKDTVSFGSGEARGLFMSGDSAMAIISTHIASAVEESGLEYGENFEMTFIPTKEEDMEPKPIDSGFQWAVHENSEHKEEAIRFIKYLTRSEGQREFNIGYMEAQRKSVYEMEDYQEAKPWRNFVRQQMEFTRPLPDLAEWMDVSDAIQLAIQDVLGNEDANPAEVAEEYQQQIDNAVETE